MTEKRDILKKVSTAVSIGSTAYTVGRALKGQWDDKHTYTVRVNADAYIFRDLLVWIHDETNNNQYSSLISEDDKTKLSFDMNRTCKFVLDGHVVKVYKEVGQPNVRSNEWGEMQLIKDEVIFNTKSRAGIRALEKKFDELRKEKIRRKKTVMSYHNTNYGWRAKPLLERPLDSIFLPDGVKEDLVADFEHFMESEDDYTKMGAPWHRGYLFYGPPGNGKSSLAAALATKYSKHIYSLPLASIENDNVLMERVSDIERGSILLLEDLDIFSSSVTREKEGTKVTLAGLLNALDGVNTPHGLIVIMTTNIVDNLDAALIRPGRADKRLELHEPVDSQIKNLFSYLYEESLGVTPKKFDSMAEYVNILKSHIDDPEGARLEIKSE